MQITMYRKENENYSEIYKIKKEKNDTNTVIDFYLRGRTINVKNYEDYIMEKERYKEEYKNFQDIVNTITLPESLEKEETAYRYIQALEDLFCDMFSYKIIIKITNKTNFNFYTKQDEIYSIHAILNEGK